MAAEQEAARLGVLVGVDGSRASLAAVDWAAQLGADTGAPLTLCLVVPDDPSFGLPADPSIAEDVRERGKTALHQAREHALRSQPHANLAIELVSGQPAATLCDMAARAQLLVVGSHGTGWFDRLLIGSTSTQVAAHAPGIVVVTRMEGRRVDGPVLVGVDASAQSQAALEFGFQTAARLDRGLLALHAYGAPASALALRKEPAVAGRLAATELLDEALAPWIGKFPGVRVRREVQQGSASRILVQTSINAALVALGSRGRGGFAGLALGSVSQHVLALASCPVAIAH